MGKERRGPKFFGEGQERAIILRSYEKISHQAIENAP